MPRFALSAACAIAAIILAACPSSEETPVVSSDSGACNEQSVKAGVCSNVGESCSTDVWCCRCLTGPTCARPEWTCMPSGRNDPGCPKEAPAERTACELVPGFCVYCGPNAGAFECIKVDGEYKWLNEDVLSCDPDAGQ